MSLSQSSTLHPYVEKFCHPQVCLLIGVSTYLESHLAEWPISLRGDGVPRIAAYIVRFSNRGTTEQCQFSFSAKKQCWSAAGKTLVHIYTTAQHCVP
jgi:hypothetical protein